MDPATTGSIIDNIVKLGPLSTNVLLMVAVAALWKKMNNGYFEAIQSAKTDFGRRMDDFDHKLDKIEERLYDAMDGKYDRRNEPRQKKEGS